MDTFEALAVDDRELVVDRWLNVAEIKRWQIGAGVLAGEVPRLVAIPNVSRLRDGLQIRDDGPLVIFEVSRTDQTRGRPELRQSDGTSILGDRADTCEPRTRSDT